MHDPKFWVSGGCPVPLPLCGGLYPRGRHTVLFGPPGFVDTHFLNVTGLCHFGRWPEYEELFCGVFSRPSPAGTTAGLTCRKPASAWSTCGIGFNLREGICELKWPINPRLIGNPPQTAGPLGPV